MKKDKHKDKVQKKKKKPLIAPKTKAEQKKEIKKKRNRRKIPLIQLDRGGNIISNFFSNFFKQLKNPTRTWMDIMLEKMLVIKIDESEKKSALKAEKPLDIMGPVKTVFRYVNNKGNNLSPSEKESLRQRTNQPIEKAVKREQGNEEEGNKAKKTRLGI